MRALGAVWSGASASEDAADRAAPGAFVLRRAEASARDGTTLSDVIGAEVAPRRMTQRAVEMSTIFLDKPVGNPGVNDLSR